MIVFYEDRRHKLVDDDDIISLADDLEFQVAKIGIDLKAQHPTLGKPADQMQTLVQKR